MFNLTIPLVDGHSGPVDLLSMKYLNRIEKVRMMQKELIPLFLMSITIVNKHQSSIDYILN